MDYSTTACINRAKKEIKNYERYYLLGFLTFGEAYTIIESFKTLIKQLQTL